MISFIFVSLIVFCFFQNTQSGRAEYFRHHWKILPDISQDWTKSYDENMKLFMEAFNLFLKEHPFCVPLGVPKSTGYFSPPVKNIISHWIEPTSFVEAFLFCD